MPQTPIECDDEGNCHTTSQAVADFEARIVEEITNESGDKTYHIKGKGKRGGPFELEIKAEDFADTRRLKAALSASVGAKDPIRATMQAHIGPAIKLLTPDALTQIKRYERTGWNSTQFLLPGREYTDDIDIRIPRKLPYGISQTANLDSALDAFESLVLAMEQEKSTPILAFALQAPLAYLADWRNERYALFVCGRTGSLKTSYAQVVMSIYGDFMRDDLLIKWGEGATRNAIMAMATHAYDLPLLFDNFKPSTGGGTRDFINLIHNILEGGEKDRLNRASQLRDTKPVYCWPLITGEDIPDKDPATLARTLVIQFTWQRGQPNPDLTRAQKCACHLPAIGESWISWLESDESRDIIAKEAHWFESGRDEWAKYLRENFPDMVNILRVASNLTTNQITWEIAKKHPAFGDILQKYDDEYQDGIKEIAASMGMRTHESLEATIFLDGLRQLIAIGQATFESLQSGLSGSPVTQIGWKDLDDSVYILINVVRRKVEDLVGRN
jgi:hypothetical protein